jgi:hypothetical protein
VSIIISYLTEIAMRRTAKTAKKATKYVVTRASKAKRRATNKSLAPSVTLPYRPKSFTVKSLRKVVASIHS